MRRFYEPLHLLCGGILFLTLCGFLGWLYETVLTSVVWGEFCGFFARGMLHLPVCPIYGFFAFGLLGIFRIPVLHRLEGPGRLCAGLIVGAAVSTVLELAASYLLEWLLGSFPWSYEGWICNFENRISLLSALIFGAMTVILLLLEPVCTGLYKRIPAHLLCAAGLVCGAALLTDAILVFF